MDFTDYVIAVKFHLQRLGTEGKWYNRMPNVHEIAWARSLGMSPKKYAEWWVRRAR